MAKKTTKKVLTGYLERVEKEIQTNQSKVSMILGALIIIVIGVLIFNFFNKPKADLGPAQQTQAGENQYTVLEGDTLFTIADKYYQNGYMYTEIAKANNITNPDQLETGQTLQIPALPSTQQDQQDTQNLGTEDENTTVWGLKIDGNTYTVIDGDWLSTIAGRAYGDIQAFDKIAQANNISDPNLIEPGTVLTIPR